MFKMHISGKIKYIYNKLIKTKINYFLIGFAILILYYLLIRFRFKDTTVLMSWDLVFRYTEINIYILFLLLSIIIFISFVISKVNIFNRYNSEKYHILFLFFSAFIIGSLFWNIPEINPDAARYITQAKYLEEYGIWSYLNDWGHELFAYVDFPSIPFFYGIIFRYLGEYREYIQLFNTILFALTSVLIYKISKRLWNEEIGLYSGLLLMSFPYLLSQVPLTLVDIPIMFLTILFAFLILKVFDNKYYNIPASLVVFFIIYAKMTSILMIIPAIFILIINYKLVFKNPHRWIFTIFLSMVMVILFFLWKRDVFIDQILYILNIKNEGSFVETPVNYLFQIGAIVMSLVVLSIIIPYKKMDKNYIILIVSIIIPYFILYLRIRYLIPVFPFIAIMASLSIYHIFSKDVKKFLVLSIAMTSIFFAIYTYIPFEENFTDMNIKNAADFTNTLNISEIQLFLVFPETYPFNPEPFVSLFDLYSHKKIIYSNDNKFYPGKDSSNSWTALYKLPDFYNQQKPSNSSDNDRIIVVFSEKEQSNSLPSKYLEEHILIKKFERKTYSILGPSSVKVYVPLNNS